MSIKRFDPDAGLAEFSLAPAQAAPTEARTPSTLGASALEARLLDFQDALKNLPEDAAPAERGALHIQMGDILVELERGTEAWALCRPAFDQFIASRDWEGAAHICDILYQADQPGSLSALGQGIWLSVTFPMDPELSVNLLHHVVEDTPDDSDGAAVAAATAVFLADIRAEDNARDNLLFFANQILGSVARRHDNIETEEQFQFWYQRLELDDPDRFLPRLRNVVDVLVQDDWWIDREQIHAQLPVN